MTKKQQAFICLVLGALILSATVLYNSLATGMRSISHLIRTYPVPLIVSLGLLIAFVILSRE